MPTMTLVLLGGGLLLVVVVIILVIVSRRRPQQESTIESRLADFGERDAPVTLEELEMSASFAERIVYPAMDALSKFVSQFTPAKTMENVQHKLELAENPGNLTPGNFMVIRVVAMVVLAGLMFGLMTIARVPASRRLLFTGIVALVGFFLPSLWLQSKIKRRQSEIVKQLPDGLDLLTICVEAGLGFDQGVQKVVAKQDNELSRGLNRYLQEVALGKIRRDALQSMAYRMDVADVTSFVAAIVQADALGVSMAKILRIQSDQMRIRRRQRAEQKAHQAPIKMLFPMVFLIFPSIFIILLGPAILLLMESGVLGTVV